MRIANIVREMREQDNAATAWPLFLVQQERRIFGMDPSIDNLDYIWGWKDDWEYTEEPDAIISRIREDDVKNVTANLADDEIDPEDFGWEKLCYVTIWEHVTAHFTRRSAEQYIEANRHNLNNPRVYVESQHRCPEWQAVVTWLKEGA